MDDLDQTAACFRSATRARKERGMIIDAALS